MDKKIVYLAVAVVVGIGIGSAFLGRSSDPVLKRMLEQQEQLASQQKQIIGGLGLDAPGEESLVNVLKRQKELEHRIELVEQKLTQIGNIAAPAERQFPPAEDFDKVYDIPIEQSYIRGPKEAAVTIVEFVDFQCPFCARFHPAIEEVLKAYPNDLRYIIKNFPLPFHPEARPAAKAALAAGEQGKYWEMADMLLENSRALSEEKYKEFASQVGLNVEQFMKDLKEKDAQWEKIIDTDMELGANVAVGGTPTFFLNGKKTMSRDFNTYKKEIDAILNEKK